MGTLPFEEVASSLCEIGFDGVCTIEIAPGFHGSTPEASKPHAKESLLLWRSLIEKHS